MSKLCQRCEKPVEFAEVFVSLPPHDQAEIKKVCFECGLLIVAEYNESLGKETKSILVVKPKEESKDEEV